MMRVEISLPVAFMCAEVEMFFARRTLSRSWRQLLDEAKVFPRILKSFVTLNRHENTS
jgi:hypothetical protein